MLLDAKGNNVGLGKGELFCCVGHHQRLRKVNGEMFYPPSNQEVFVICRWSIRGLMVGPINISLKPDFHIGKYGC